MDALREAVEGTPGAELPSHGPVLERPTLQLLLGSVSEEEIGLIGNMSQCSTAEKIKRAQNLLIAAPASS